MMTAIGCDPCSHSVTTPPNIVLAVSLPRKFVYVIGKKFAGKYSTAEVTNHAHVY